MCNGCNAILLQKRTVLFETLNLLVYYRVSHNFVEAWKNIDTVDTDTIVKKILILGQEIGRGGGSVDAAGAFAPVNFQQRVQCTRPDKDLSYKWPFFSPKRTLLMLKMRFIFKFWECRILHVHLKSLMHPSCQVLGAAPDWSMNYRVKNFITIGN